MDRRSDMHQPWVHHCYGQRRRYLRGLQTTLPTKGDPTKAPAATDIAVEAAAAV